MKSIKEIAGRLGTVVCAVLAGALVASLGMEIVQAASDGANDGGMSRYKRERNALNRIASGYNASQTLHMGPTATGAHGVVTPGFHVAGLWIHWRSQASTECSLEVDYGSGNLDTIIVWDGGSAITPTSMATCIPIAPVAIDIFTGATGISQGQITVVAFGDSLSSTSP